MRILLLKSLLLCTNCPSFLPILCGIFLFLSWICFCFCCGCLFLIVFAVNPFCFCRGFVFAVDSFLFLPWMPFVSVVESFLFLSWICSAVNAFVYIPSYFLFFSFLPCSFNFLLRNPKNVGVFLEKVHCFFENLHRFFENLHRFLGLHSNF